MLTIRRIAETPHAAAVAAWLHAAWWDLEGWSLAATQAFLEAAAGPAAPIAFVAERDGAPVGTATLDTDDLESRPDLTPWLASVWVAPSWRGQGVATALVRHVEATAAALGLPELWLHTADAVPLYARLGWQPIGMETWQGKPTTLMRRRLRRP